MGIAVLILPSIAIAGPSADPASATIEAVEPRMDDVKVPPPDLGPPPRVVGLHLGAGGSVMLGNSEGDEGDAMFEPATKVLIPLEIGLRIQAGNAFWMRFCAFSAPVLNGKLLYAAIDQTIEGSLMGFGGTVGMGGTVGHVDAGLLVGVLWPGRIPLGAIVAYRLGDTGMRIEPEVGVNIGTPRETGAGPRVEPTVALGLTFDPLFASKRGAPHPPDPSS